jgi:hypothetical protein
MKLISLWSFRFSVAKGFHWQHERECLLSNGLKWLEVYSGDEPGIEFKLSYSKPKD